MNFIVIFPQKKAFRMNNPFSVANRGKGVIGVFARSGAIIQRYGLTNTKMSAAFSQLIEVLNEFDCSATLPVTASPLSRNLSLGHRLQSQGLELAVHGNTHVDYSHQSFEQQVEQIDQANQVFKQSGISVSGFRCPYLRWNMETLKAVSELGFKYDSSQALAWNLVGGKLTDSYHRVLEFYNAQKSEEYPSLPRMVDNLVRIPYCLPDDEALVERFKMDNQIDIADIWLAMLDRIYDAGELFSLGLHPERIFHCIDALRAVLVKARSLSPIVWIARLDEIATWYRSLGEVSFTSHSQNDGRTHICINAPLRATLLARSIDIRCPKKTWAHGYDHILSNEFDFDCDHHPWIGLAPDCPDLLKNFLQHQGFLVEISSNPSAFYYYFQQNNFDYKDERPLLAELESGNYPLLRIGRWPSGAQAALAITGDVDAFNLVDYGLRLWNR